MIIAIIFDWFFLGYSQRPPALQSVWFIPHVAVYMFAYVIIAMAFVLAIWELCFTSCENPKRMLRLNFLVKIGTVALGIGMCLGALWAKKVWGQYWSWDIKETAALVTWAIFLLYIHLQKIKKINRKCLLLIVIFGFFSLLFTWQGVKFLPVAQKSPHTFYSSY